MMERIHRYGLQQKKQPITMSCSNQNIKINWHFISWRQPDNEAL
ncbi:hypothetical protein [Candidatus Enterococcus lemimoniae]|nr:hypothetical protein [Enterococcus sp. 12C11_DIV0727]